MGARAAANRGAKAGLGAAPGAGTSAGRELLVVCSYFPSDTLVERTIEAFAEVADLYLVPVEPGVPGPAAARPHHPGARLGLDDGALAPVKKWRTIDRILRRLDLARYRWAFFPDDDLEYGDGFAERFLGLLEAHDVALAQPALTPDSYHTYPICVRRPDCLLRLTNFVEVMAPCFRRDALELLRATLDAETSPMGYGFDLHWPYACERHGLRMAVVDETPIAHRFRPTGKHYRGDDLHGQGYAYGRRWPRILTHEICVREEIRRNLP